MILTITGNDAQLKAISKQIEGRAKKYSLKVSLTEENQEAAKVAPDTISKAGEVIELIEACETPEALKEYKSDKRATVKKAYEAKLATFE